MCFSENEVLKMELHDIKKEVYLRAGCFWMERLKDKLDKDRYRQWWKVCGWGQGLARFKSNLLSEFCC